MTWCKNSQLKISEKLKIIALLIFLKKQILIVIFIDHKSLLLENFPFQNMSWKFIVRVSSNKNCKKSDILALLWAALFESYWLLNPQPTFTKFYCSLTCYPLHWISFATKWEKFTKQLRKTLLPEIKFVLIIFQFRNTNFNLKAYNAVRFYSWAL